MRPEESSVLPVSNGFTGNANGSTPKKSFTGSSLNGHTSRSINGSGSPHTNGTTKAASPVRPPTYYGHDREEVTRILIQGLLDMGYNGAAASLGHESGFELESPSVAAFRIAILEGQWSEAENLLLGSRHSQDGVDGYESNENSALVLAEGADRGQMLFWMRQQKFLELLEQRELSLALMVLRQELTPLNHDVHQLHLLTSLLMCPKEDLRAQAHWEGTIEESRRELLHELTRSISPSVMIRDHRLAELLDQVKRGQINNCLYHNTSLAPSLYSDHMCERADFPLRTLLELDHHTQEVWYLQFSHDGRWLATASQDESVIIYDTTMFTISHRLTGHNKEVTYVSWSPDDTKLISCCLDTKARVWDVSTGRCIMTVDHQSSHPVSAASWAPDSRSFVTSCFDKQTQLCHWSLDGPDSDTNIHTWSGGFRAQDCSISPDGEKLVVIDSDKHIYVYNFQTYEEEYRITFPCKSTSVTISRDSSFMLVNLTSGEVQLLEINTGILVRKFEGQKQEKCIIRSSFGGADENFILSGSEDSKIYIWHRGNGVLVDTLQGHGNGCVNAVAWNPVDPGMFASAGDDRRVRIWSSTVPPNDAIVSAGDRRPASNHSYTRTSALRSTFMGESNLSDAPTKLSVSSGDADEASMSSASKPPPYEFLFRQGSQQGQATSQNSDTNATGRSLNRQQHSANSTLTHALQASDSKNLPAALLSIPSSYREPVSFAPVMAATPGGYSINVNDPTLIALVNKLQDVFTTVGVQNPIDLPQIVVVGSQSSGKSSVLENIVGRDFLPRGSGIVTRRPLVLQLVNRPSAATLQTNGIKEEDLKATSDKEANVDEWGEFLHMPGQKFYDFNKIRDEIVKETEAKAGRNVGVSPAPINLRIYSPNVLTLTLVDLPGLTKVPVGDQPKDIERQIKDMVLKQISKSNSIILAVTAANQDLANSDGLKLAREVDPEGQRTIGVLTKVDLMDEGTDVVDILAGRIIPLRLGYVPVVNRGQRDIENKKRITAALEAEKSFFENHKAYRNKASYCGTPYLARKLNLILMMHIKQTLPDIKARITGSLQKYTQELQQLGEGDLLGNSANIVLNIITEFSNEYRTVLDGNNQELSSVELSGGARISFVFHELYANGIKAVDPFDQVKDIDIRTILYNSSGSSPALFVGTTAFELIVKQQIRRLEDPSLKCVSLVFDELVRILGQLLQKSLFRRYPQLKEKFHSVVIAFFRKVMDPTNKLVRDLVAMEACYINTGHPDFLNGHRAMAIVNDRHSAAKPTQVDPKTGKPLPPTVPPRASSPSLPVDGSDPNAGFFGSFFASKNKKKMAAMEAPPATLKASGTLSERENQEVEVIKLLINSYFNITRRTMIDMVPKAIMLTLVQWTKDEMQRELLEQMYRTQELDDLLKESDYTVRRRKECQQMVESLSRASEIVSQVQ